MKVLGIRVNPKKTRIAIVVREAKKYIMISSHVDSRLTYPADLKRIEHRVDWLFREMNRLHHDHPDIDRVCIKTNEYAGQDTKAKRETAYLEAATMLYWRQQSIPVSAKTYKSLATRSADAKKHAESRVGRTDKLWDTQMADAVIAAWMELSS